MNNFYNRNGLIFWNEEAIEFRRTLERKFTLELRLHLLAMNPAFQFVQVEAPLLTPQSFINPNYTSDDVYSIENTDLVLRPETTMGSYAAAKELLSGYSRIKYRPPLVVWQHGKSFRREQDQATKFMRLKEFYQLEYQILYGLNTANDYYPNVVRAAKIAIESLIGPCTSEPSDRLPDYSSETTDIICVDNAMEVCSISRRHDYEGLKNIEVAIGSDRIVYNFERKSSAENEH